MFANLLIGLGIIFMFLEYFLVRLGRIRQRYTFTLLGILSGLLGGVMSTISIIPLIEQSMKAFETYLENDIRVKTAVFPIILVLNTAIFWDVIDEKFAQSWFETSPNIRYVWIFAFAFSGTVGGWLALTYLIINGGVAIASLFITLFVSAFVFKLAER